MIGYLILFIALLLFTYLGNEKGKEKAALITLGLTLLFVFMALDIHRIHDVPHYEEFFYEIQNYSLSEMSLFRSYFETGYVVLNIIVAKIYPSFKFFYFIYALIIISAYFLIIWRYSDHVWLSGILLVCTFFFPLFLLRQYLAMAICMFSIPFILRRKPIPFFLLMILAYNFHRSALVFSICYFLPIISLNRKNLFLYIVGSGIVIASISLFDRFITNVVMGSSLVSHYELYLQEGASNSWKSAAIAVADLLFAYYCYKGHFNELNSFQKLFFNMCAIYALLAVIGVVGSVFQAVYRILPYFSLSILVLLPNASGYIKSKTTRVLMLSAIILLYFYSLISASSHYFYFNF